MTPDEIVAALPGLRRYALSLTGAPERADDLVQEVALIALEGAASFRGESAPATWLHRIAHNRFINQVQRGRETPVDEDSLALAVEEAWRDDEYTVDAEAVLVQAERREELQDALVGSPRPTDRRCCCTTSKGCLRAKWPGCRTSRSRMRSRGFDAAGQCSSQRWMAVWNVGS